MADIPKISDELLLRAFARPSLGQTIQAGTEGFKTGTDIGISLAEQKAKRKKEEMELMKEIQKMTAQQKLIKEAQTPIEAKKSIAKPAFQAMEAAESPTGEVAVPEGPARQVQPSIFKASRSPLEMKQAEEEKQQRMIGYATEAEPETAAKKLLGGEAMSGSGMKEQQIQMAVVDQNGRSRTVKGIKKMGQDGIFHPVTGKKVEDLNELPDAGYKISLSVIGRDPNTDLPITFNDQTQQMMSGGRPYSGIVFPKLENAPEGFRKGLQDYRVAKNQLTMIADSFNSFKDKPTGPLSGRFMTLEEWAGTNDPDAARFMSQVRTFQNAMIKAITGAQMSEPEARRLMGQMPTFKDNPQAFAEKLQVSAENIDIAMKEALDTAEASGYAVEGLSSEQASKIVSDMLGIPTRLTPQSKPKIISGTSKKQTASGIQYEVE